MKRRIMHARDIDGAMDDARDGSETLWYMYMSLAWYQETIDGAKDDARERHRPSDG
jgi:hypothetical protein